MSYLLTFALIGALIAIHEYGHLLAAKLCGIPVERFSVGFGPRLCGFRWRGTSYWLSAVPLGGYVLPAPPNDDMITVPVWRRIVFALGGPAANIVAAFGGLWIINVVLVGESPAQGLVTSSSQLSSMVGQLLAAVPGLFSTPEQLNGIVGILVIGGEQFATSAQNLLVFSAILNVNLAIFNLLPIPPLDGARIVFCILEKLSPRATRLEPYAMVVGWGLILILMVYVTYNDVGRIFASGGA